VLSGGDAKSCHQCRAFIGGFGHIPLYDFKTCTDSNCTDLICTHPLPLASSLPQYLQRISR
ncbi:hypothetical protein ACTHTP_11435, partial [Neisseria sp. P0017.S001]